MSMWGDDEEVDWSDWSYRPVFKMITECHHALGANIMTLSSNRLSSNRHVLTLVCIGCNARESLPMAWSVPRGVIKFR